MRSYRIPLSKATEAVVKSYFSDPFLSRMKYLYTEKQTDTQTAYLVTNCDPVLLETNGYIENPTVAHVVIKNDTVATMLRQIILGGLDTPSYIDVVEFRDILTAAGKFDALFIKAIPDELPVHIEITVTEDAIRVNICDMIQITEAYHRLITNGFVITPTNQKQYERFLEKYSKPVVVGRPNCTVAYNQLAAKLLMYCDEMGRKDTPKVEVPVTLTVAECKQQSPQLRLFISLAETFLGKFKDFKLPILMGLTLPKPYPWDTQRAYRYVITPKDSGIRWLVNYEVAQVHIQTFFLDGTLFPPIQKESSK